MSVTLKDQFNKIKAQNRLGLMTHVVMGYPSLAETKDRVLRMIDAGVDIIELQLPCSDPLADGPAIMQANQVAIANGVTIQACFQLAAELIQTAPIPLQFIGYYNTVLQYGAEKFVQDSKKIDIAGFTFPDLPIEEESYEHFFQLAHEANIPIIQLLTPATTSARIQQLNQTAQGYYYATARFGTTGEATVISESLKQYLQLVKQYATLPVAVGFGIRQPEQIRALHGLADVAVVGSALLDSSGPDLTDQLQKLCASR